MPDIAQKTIGDSMLLFDPRYIADISSDMFDAAYWQQQGKVTGQAMGRGVTTFFCHQQQHYVLRHYRRGGLFGKLVRDSYLYSGLKRTRAWAEMHLLQWMSAQGLPVPTAVAARITRRGWLYQADMIQLKIADAQDVFGLLLSTKLKPELWFRIGVCIQQLHQLQVYHHDLNIHNILLDDAQKVWLIDFDKCDRRHGEQWKPANLQRLLRSLRKEKAKNPLFHWQESDWQALLAGYAQC